MANTYLQNTTTTATDTKKFTWSMWVKRSLLGSPAQRIWNIYADTNNKAQVAFNTDDQFSYYDKLGGSEVWSQTPKMKLRDTSAWYHIVVAVDTTQGTEADRAKIYINGELQTELEVGGSYPSINASTGTQIVTSSNNRRIGSNESANTHFNGLISHLHFVDGTAYPASTFGSTDATTGQWKINTSPSITMGTNGFTILKDGNTITDQSSNSNDFSLGGGTLTKTEDCPSNVFATFNPLIGLNGAVFGNGNTYFYRTSGGNDRTIPANIGASSGKYYAEFKIGASMYAGVLPINGLDVEKTQTGVNNHLGQHSGGYSLGTGQNGAVTYNAGSLTASGFTWSGTEIIQIALDLDNSKVFIGKNNVWANSSNPENNTGGYSIQSGLTYTFGCTNSNADTACNFGNGHFQSTAISSAGTNASGNGVFELNVPTGYTALSTKGLNL